jgi:flagellar protein FlgJ
MDKPIFTQTSADLAIDAQTAGRVKNLGKQNSQQAALKETTKQFEALFINMMLQSMHKATPQSGLFQSYAKDIYTSMQDEQLSKTVAQRGIGLADMMLKQLTKLNSTDTTATIAGSAAQQAASLGLMNSENLPPVATQTLMRAVASYPGNGSLPWTRSVKGDNPLFVDENIVEGDEAEISSPVDAFRAKMAVHANEASRMTGIPAHFILGQAAMESGWGQREINMADGRPSHNLFGVKAGANWKGKVADVTTTEYVNGAPRKVVARFRAYDTHAEAFRDYASLLNNNERYGQLSIQGQTATGFAQGLQHAGYATDPDYANKLVRVIKQLQS